MKLRRTMKAQNPKKKEKERNNNNNNNNKEKRRGSRSGQRTCSKDLGQARGYAARISTRGYAARYMFIFPTKAIKNLAKNQVLSL